MMVSSPTVTKPITRTKNHADYDNDSSTKGRSPLSRSLWDSPPNTSSNHRSATPAAPSSSQRKLFGFEQVENIENDRHVSKKKCSKELKVKQDSATSKSTTAVAFSELFSEGKSSSSALLSAMVGGRSSSRSKKSVLLGPRLSLTRRQSKTPLSLDHGTLPIMEEKSTLGLKSPPKLAPRSPPKLFPQSASKKASKKVIPKLSPRKDPMLSPLHPPRNPLRANNTNDYFNDFSTLTPTVLYGQAPAQGGHYRSSLMQAPMSTTATPRTTPRVSQQQYYHQSPHWSGQVRVNPFSPIPEQYLRPPPTSTKSVNRASGKGRPGFYQFLNNLEGNFDEPPSLGLGLGVGEEELLLMPPNRKKARLNPIRLASRTATTAAIPRLDTRDFSNEISPTDVMQGNKRKATKDVMRKPPPPSMLHINTDAPLWQTNDSNKRMRVKRGRYLDDFQEVQFLGAGSFGSVNACLSRLDGCMYAVKSISPAGRQSTNSNTVDTGVGPGVGMDGQTAGTMAGGADYLYGGRRMMSNQCGIPPTPRRDVFTSPLRRKKAMSRFGIMEDESADGGMTNEDDDCGGYDLGVLEGSSHWNDGALRRMLREVFALAALCQQDDFRTFHIVRYQQAWLEDDGTLYIQTELCSATLRDELSGKADIDAGVTLDVILQTTSNPSSSVATATMDVFRQLKLLREVLLALELVHQQGMVHLDIKPENIMVKNNLYKLGDFGLANVFTKSEEKAGKAVTAAATDIEEGDSRYMSKDLLDFNPKDLTKCDIFSLGATMYEVCSGRPLPSCGQEWQDLRNGKLACPLRRHHNFDGGSNTTTMPCLAAIIREMMHPDPEKRPSATQLLSREILGGGQGVDNPLLGSARESSSYKMGGRITSARPTLKRSTSCQL